MNITTNINLPNYSIEYKPTESYVGGTLLYINNNIAYKRRKDLNIHKSHELESTFIEIIKIKLSNKILGVVYRHPTMDFKEFNDNYVNKLLDNIAKENKTIFLLGDFNIVLLKYDSHTPKNEFFDSFSSGMVLPYILHRTRVIPRQLMIYFLTIYHIISDHLPQFLIIPSIFLGPSSSNYNVYERCWSHFTKEELILDYFEKKGVLTRTGVRVNLTSPVVFLKVHLLKKR